MRDDYSILTWLDLTWLDLTTHSLSQLRLLPVINWCASRESKAWLTAGYHNQGLQSFVWHGLNNDYKSTVLCQWQLCVCFSDSCVYVSVTAVCMFQWQLCVCFSDRLDALRYVIINLDRTDCFRVRVTRCDRADCFSGTSDKRLDHADCFSGTSYTRSGNADCVFSGTSYTCSSNADCFSGTRYTCSGNTDCAFQVQVIPVRVM